MSESLKQLRSMPIEQLMQKHDDLAKHTEVGTRHYLDEIHRRDSQKDSSRVVILTKWITLMTLIIMVATITNVIVFIP